MTSVVEKNIRAYDATVDAYHENTKNLEEVEVRLRKEFLRLLKKSRRILDVACGPGRDAKIFSEKGFDVTGIDASGKMIEKAKKVAPKAKFGVMDFLEMDFEKESFGGVFFSAGLLCIRKKSAARVLKKILGVLVPEGILFISVKEGSGEGFELDKRYGMEKYYAYYAEEEVRGLLEAIGFEILKLEKPPLKSLYHTHQWIYILCKKPQK